MEDGLRTYVEYHKKFRPHMGLHGLTPYKKLKELQEGKTLKSFEACNNLFLDKIFNFGIIGNVRGKIKDEILWFHPI